LLSTLLPYTTLFRSVCHSTRGSLRLRRASGICRPYPSQEFGRLSGCGGHGGGGAISRGKDRGRCPVHPGRGELDRETMNASPYSDRKSTRLNSSHVA